MKISGLTILSNAVTYGYPFIESIKSVLPSVDELVVVLDVNTTDTTRQELEKLPVRIVMGYFDLDVVGWYSYGIMRTLGYQACTGDVVAMFDADGVVHEKNNLKQELTDFGNSDRYHGFWTKYRFYRPTLYRHQNKHSGIYNKSKIGDRFDFYHPDGRGIPNMTRGDYGKGLQLGTVMYGYEHFWDTEEVFRKKVARYGKMIDKHGKRLPKTDQEYYEQYMRELKEQMIVQGKHIQVTAHPKSMQEKIATLTDKHFAFNWFE